jgi:hypothetical protein
MGETLFWTSMVILITGFVTLVWSCVKKIPIHRTTAVVDLEIITELSSIWKGPSLKYGDTITFFENNGNRYQTKDAAKEARELKGVIAGAVLTVIGIALFIFVMTR